MTIERVFLGTIRTGDAACPVVEALGISAGFVIARGTRKDVATWGARPAQVDDFGARTILPGFHDAHLHFLALARRRDEVDCGFEVCPSFRSLECRLAEAARDAPPGRWIRAFGFDEALLDPPRVPTRGDLDRAVPDHPLRLLHRTGHAALLNGCALEQLGPEVAARLEPSATGELPVRLLEPGPILRGRLPSVDGSRLAVLCGEVSRDLLAAGITSLHDPTPGQSDHELECFRTFVAEGRVRQRVGLYGDFDREPDRGQRVRRLGRKIVLGGSTQLPNLADFRGPFAIHAVEGAELVGALELLRGRRDSGHRLEHAALCPPVLASEVGRLGATVVTHPDFLVRFGRKYRREIPPEQHEWLYPLATWRASGVPVAFGSDAPIAAPHPMAAVAAAVTRGSPEGPAFGRSQAVDVGTALGWHSWAGRLATEGISGALAPGAHADLVVLADDPERVPASELAGLPVVATIIAGEVAWAS